MAEPTTRQTFIDTCKRRLGHPVVEINVTEEQFDDRVDQALKYFYDFHFNGTDKTYYKHQITANNRPDKVYDLTVTDGGTLYANGDTVTITGGGGQDATATLITDGSGVITSATVANNGDSYATVPTIGVTSGTGSGATITATLGGFVPMPENIIGAVHLWPMGDSNSSVNNMFSIKYQIALNDIYTLTSSSMVPYFSAFQHIALIQDLLVGHIPIRYNRHKNRLYVDMDWNIAVDGNYLLMEAYEIVDPAEYVDVWKDHWLIKYGTALFKLQWGSNLKLFQGVLLPGGIQVDGQTIYDEAFNEIQQMETEMINSYSIPAMDFVG